MLKKFFSALVLFFLSFSLFAFNYGEALQKTIYFYEAQQAGPLPAWNRVEWRGDSTMGDEVLGGLYDAGDHVKFNLPMSYTASMLGWAVYEYGDAFEAAGQLGHISNNIKFILDYLMESTASSPYAYQVGSGNADHSWWGPVEVAHLDPQAGIRPTLRAASGISCVLGQSAAALAIGGKIFGNTAYINRAKTIFAKAAADESDAVYKASDAATFYNSWSGPIDELMWASIWLYIATNDSSYLDKAEAYVSKLNKQPNSPLNVIEYKWGHCWDDSHYGGMIMLAKLTGKQQYKDFAQMHLDWWTPAGYNGESVSYSPGGLAWLTSWGALRHSTTSAFLAFVYGNWVNDPVLKQRYLSFAENQIDYALGDNPRNASYVMGYGLTPPQHPHHRTAHSSWTDSMNIPENHRHTLYGALVGGPDANDGYKDDIKDYVMNEVACDYNAGIVGGLAAMVGLYGGTPLAGFPAPEVKEDEFFMAGTAAANGSSVAMNLNLNNRSGWPARVASNLKFRYFMDLSEVISAGGSPSSITSISHYSEFANTISAPVQFSGNYYYIEVVFKNSADVWPGGNGEHAAEVQLNIQGPSSFNSGNDWSFAGFGAVDGKNRNIVIYDGNTILWGNEPPGTGTTPTPRPTPTPVVTPTAPPACAVKGDVNGSGAADIVDALMIAQYYVGLNPVGFNPACADVNGDLVVTIVDALKVAQYYVGLIPSL